MDRPLLVSISCITYNHAPYIRQCLDGFLMQKTDFAFEVLIHDDCSTDGTTDIIKEYEAKYPNIIKPLYEEENQWIKGRRGSGVFNFPRAQGKYIAMCEGDDYWIDPLKLQKQVDFMEANPNYSMCFARAMEHYEDGSRPDKLFSLIEDRDYEGIEFYENWIVPTATALLKASVVESVIYKASVSSGKFIHGDIVIFLSSVAYGKVRGFSDIYSVYRRHTEGATFVRTKQMSQLLMQHNENIPVFFGEQYLSASKKRIVGFALQGYISSKFKEVALLKDAFMIAPIHSIKLIIKMLFNKLIKKVVI